MAKTWQQLKDFVNELDATDLEKEVKLRDCDFEILHVDMFDYDSDENPIMEIEVCDIDDDDDCDDDE